MAVIDYGAIVFKNGKLLTKEMFTDMKEAVGWEDTENMVDYRTQEPLGLKSRYFTYVGDEENTIGFYKSVVTFVQKNDTLYTQDIEYLFDNNFDWTKYTTYVGDEICTITKRNGYLVLRWNYKGDKYKVYFGYGVDLDAYKKYRIVNYYRSIPYYIHKIPYNINNKIIELRYFIKEHLTK